MEQRLKLGFDKLKSMGPTPERQAIKDRMKVLKAAYEARQWDDPEPPKAPPERRGSILNPIAEGATFGASAELGALGGAAVAAATGQIPEGETFGDAYTSMRDSIEGDIDGYRERNPVGSFAAETIGNAVPAGKIANYAVQSLRPGSSPAARIASEAGITGAMGAAYHGATAEPGERGEAALQGGLIEAGLGAGFGEVSQFARNRKSAREARQHSFANYAGDREQVRFRQTETGEIVPDALARNAIRQGIDEDTIVAIKSVTPADRKRMEMMLDVEQQRQRFPANSVNLRSADVVGDAIGKRYEAVLRLNREAGRKLDDIAQAELRDVDVSLVEPVQEFLADIHKMGAKVQWFDGPAEVDFAGSILDSKILAEQQTLLKEVLGRVERLTSGTAYDAHLAKQFIDEHINYGGKDGGASARVQAALRKLRAGINDSLRSASDDYRRVNDQYSNTLKPLEQLQSISGTRVDLTGPDAASQLGSLSRRLTSNYATRVPLQGAIRDLEKVASEYGVRFSDNINAQVMFVNELESLFGPQASTGIEAAVAQGTSRALSGSSWKEQLGQAVSSRVGPFFGFSQDEKISALRALLRQEH